MNYEIQRDKISSGFDGEYFWGQARGGVIPGEPPIGIVTTQRALRSGSDIYYAIAEFRSDDAGSNWHGPVEHTHPIRKDGKSPSAT